MKSRTYVAFMVALVLVIGAANAQMLGLPLAGDAEPCSAGDTAFSAGLVLGEDIDLYGGRLVYHVLDEAFIFGGIGAVEPDNGDTGWGIQGGFQYTLPFLHDSETDIALRGSVGYARHGRKRTVRGRRWDQYGGDFAVFDADIDVWTITGGGVISRRLDETFSIYGFLGFSYIHSDIDQTVNVKSERIWLLGGAPVTVRRYRESSTQSDIEPAFGGGALLTLTSKYSIYAELIHIEDPWFIGGIRRDF